MKKVLKVGDYMVSIKLNLDMAQIQKVCAKCDVDAKPQHYLYFAFDGDACLATGLFKAEENIAEPLFYDGPHDDSRLFDAVLRTGLNYAAQQGTPMGRLCAGFRKAHKGHFEELSYPESDIFNIEDFFMRKICG